MRVAVLCDVHGNLPALEVVVAEVERQRVDLVVSGGDLVWGPMPAETLALLRSLGDRVRYVRGNTDRLVLDSEGEHAAAHARLTVSDLDEIASWPLTLDLEVELRRTEYDFAAALERLRATGIPDLERRLVQHARRGP